jgi:hypothetical protein
MVSISTESSTTRQAGTYRKPTYAATSLGGNTYCTTSVRVSVFAVAALVAETVNA